MYNTLTKKVFFHSAYLYGLAIAIAAGIFFSYLMGEVKEWHQLNLLDVFSEGAMTVLASFWLLLVLRSRPGGRVTQLLAIGLSCIIFSWSMDLTDEFIRLPDSVVWHTWLESLPIPFALTALSIGIYHWHKEELAISAQMVKRERDFREYRLFDKLIPIGGAVYLRKQLGILIKESQKNQKPLALIAVDLDNFNYINRKYGIAEGDNILRALCQLLLLNLREQDVLCRLAGDRFVVLLPDTHQGVAESLAEELKAAVNSFAYKDRHSTERVFLSASTAVTLAGTEDSDSVFKRLNIGVLVAKQELV